MASWTSSARDTKLLVAGLNLAPRPTAIRLVAFRSSIFISAASIRKKPPARVSSVLLVSVAETKKSFSITEVVARTTASIATGDDSLIEPTINGSLYIPVDSRLS